MFLQTISFIITRFFSYLGDSLLQTIEGVDHSHVPPLALC